MANLLIKCIPFLRDKFSTEEFTFIKKMYLLHEHTLKVNQYVCVNDAVILHKLITETCIGLLSKN